MWCVVIGSQRGAPNTKQRGEVQAVVPIAKVCVPPPTQPHRKDPQDGLGPALVKIWIDITQVVQERGLR